MEHQLRVVMFTGGRGSGLLTRRLVADPDIELTLIVNGYDDGKSTGAIRRFLGDALGPSDYRKNAGRLASELGTSDAGLPDLLSYRLPLDANEKDAVEIADQLAGRGNGRSVPFDFVTRMTSERRSLTAGYLSEFLRLHETSEASFSFTDCSVGNLVFAGCYVAANRDFNEAITRYCDLLGVPRGMIENVTDGRNAFLVGVTADGKVLPGEAEIVEAARPQRIREVFLLPRRLTPEELAALPSGDADAACAFLEEREVVPEPNPHALERLREANLILFAPGTQYSSLFPSYLTRGVGEAISENVQARKLLITNIQEDAETGDASAVDLVDRAVYYLRRRGALRTPTPCLVTHFLINDPRHDDGQIPYVRLGAIDQMEDPRLVRIGDYEEVSGGHDAEKVVSPYLESLLDSPRIPRIGVLLLETDVHDKIVESVLEALRAGIEDLPLDFEFYYRSEADLDASFIEALPFSLVNVYRNGISTGEAFRPIFGAPHLDYLLLFESSGMYRGENIVSVASHLSWSGLDAVWGSRRLSVRDIQESYRFRYRHHPILGAASYLGSHLLSLAYLALFGRYVSDTLSGIRVAKASFFDDLRLDLDRQVFNQQLLCKILRGKGEIFESPVRFLPISPKMVRRTTVGDGLRSLATILRWRLAPARRHRPVAGGHAAPRPAPDTGTSGSESKSVGASS